jgi:hypothetical protein
MSWNASQTTRFCGQHVLFRGFSLCPAEKMAARDISRVQRTTNAARLKKTIVLFRIL